MIKKSLANLRCNVRGLSDTLEMNLVQEERNAECRQKKMWLKAGDESVGTIFLCIKILTREVYKLQPSTLFSIQQGFSEMLKFLRQNVKNICVAISCMENSLLLVQFQRNKS